MSESKIAVRLDRREMLEKEILWIRCLSSQLRTVVNRMEIIKFRN